MDLLQFKVLGFSHRRTANQTQSSIRMELLFFKDVRAFIPTHSQPNTIKFSHVFVAPERRSGFHTNAQPIKHHQAFALLLKAFGLSLRRIGNQTQSSNRMELLQFQSVRAFRPTHRQPNTIKHPHWIVSLQKCSRFHPDAQPSKHNQVSAWNCCTL